MDFEAGDSWLERLAAAGFDASRPAVVTSTGVSMYLTMDAIMATLRRIAAFASGSTWVMSFLCPIEMLEPEIRIGVERAAEGARAGGTPWISFFESGEIVALAREAGFEEVRHVSAAALAERYFAGRTDGLAPTRQFRGVAGGNDMNAERLAAADRRPATRAVAGGVRRHTATACCHDGCLRLGSRNFAGERERRTREMAGETGSDLASSHQKGERSPATQHCV